MKDSLDVRGGRAVVGTVAAWIVVAAGCGGGVSDGGLFSSAPDASADVQTHPDTGAGSSGTTGSTGTGTGTGVVGTSSGTGTGTGLPASSSSTGTTGTGTGTGTGKSGTGTGYDPSDPGAGDQPGSCMTPSGAPACTPGHVECSQTTSCPTPAVCCAKTSGGECASSAGDCHGGTVLACEEAGDCPQGQACCGSLSQSGAETTCKALVGGMCPAVNMGISVQVCRSDNECPSGKCSIYNCQGQNSVEACNNPSTTYCQAN
jgi:hypothetical protein